jgi:hypothetical protein
MRIRNLTDGVRTLHYFSVCPAANRRDEESATDASRRGLSRHSLSNYLIHLSIVDRRHFSWISDILLRQ